MGYGLWAIGYWLLAIGSRSLVPGSCSTIPIEGGRKIRRDRFGASPLNVVSMDEVHDLAIPEQRDRG